MPLHFYSAYSNNIHWPVAGNTKSNWDKNNSEFWREKIIGNIARDQKNYELLRDLGWNVFVIWECELKRSVMEKTLDALINNIKQGLQSATNL